MSGHALKGQEPIQVNAMEYWFGFHFLFSIIPGMTLIIALMALFSTVFPRHQLEKN